MEWYTGISKIALPVTYSKTGSKKYIIETTRLTGSFSTLYFGEPFNELKFKRQYQSTIVIAVPMKNRGSNIVIDINYDIGKISDYEGIMARLQEKTENATKYSNTDAYYYLDKTKYFSRIEFKLGST